MNKSEIEVLLSEIVEELAAIEHERWAHWQRYVHQQGIARADGALVIPAEIVRRWETQIATSYVDLSEAEKQSDREQVGRYLPLIASAISKKLS